MKTVDSCTICNNKFGEHYAKGNKPHAKEKYYVISPVCIIQNS